MVAAVVIVAGGWLVLSVVGCGRPDGVLTCRCIDGAQWLWSSTGGGRGVSQSVDLGWSNNPNTTPTKDYEKVRVVVCLRGVQRGCAEEGERGSTPTG